MPAKPRPYFWNRSCCKVYYSTVRKAMKDEAYPMSLTEAKEIQAIVLAVNEGIDSHLEACNSPDRGDSYQPGKRMAGSRCITTTLECVVSAESLPVLLRRLFNLKTDDDSDGGLRDTAESLAEDILMTLGIDESGVYVGRRALGLD